ncbi:GIY-YIG nuclease family protein [Pollutibacter soli]|uniref:GIY-YIG nuclease family protein n=1 Tax=Pollutibacter soli TaxID=3034157 RepID=UPI003013930D
MKYTVYVLYSVLANRHYTGFTSNLEMRLKSHNEFGKDWTCKFRPWAISFTTKNLQTKRRQYDMKNG